MAMGDRESLLRDMDEVERLFTSHVSTVHGLSALGIGHAVEALRRIRSAITATHPPAPGRPPDARARCEVCDWPLAREMADGCIPGNCSYRPREGTDEYRRIEARRAELAKAPDARALREALETMRLECSATCQYPHEPHTDECGESQRDAALAATADAPGEG